MALAVIRPETPSRLKATHISADVSGLPYPSSGNSPSLKFSYCSSWLWVSHRNCSSQRLLL